MKRNGVNGSMDTSERLSIEAQRICTVQDFTLFMRSLMAALAAGEVDAAAGGAICKCAFTMLKAVEMQMKYGQPTKSGTKYLTLASEDEEALPEEGKAQ